MIFLNFLRGLYSFFTFSLQLQHRPWRHWNCWRFCLHWFSHHFNWRCSQEIKRRLRFRTAVEELRKLKGQDVSVETNAKIIHTLEFPATICGRESWQRKRLIGKKYWWICNVVLENTTDTLSHQKDEQVGPNAN